MPLIFIIHILIFGSVWFAVWTLLLIAPALVSKQDRLTLGEIRQPFIAPSLFLLAGALVETAGILLLWLSLPEQTTATSLTLAQWAGGVTGSLLMLAGIIVILVAPFVNLIRHTSTS